MKDKELQLVRPIGDCRVESSGWIGGNKGLSIRSHSGNWEKGQLERHRKRRVYRASWLMEWNFREGWEDSDDCQVWELSEWGNGNAVGERRDAGEITRFSGDIMNLGCPDIIPVGNTTIKIYLKKTTRTTCCEVAPACLGWNSWFRPLSLDEIEVE